MSASARLTTAQAQLASLEAEADQIRAYLKTVQDSRVDIQGLTLDQETCEKALSGALALIDYKAAEVRMLEGLVLAEAG